MTLRTPVRTLAMLAMALAVISISSAGIPALAQSSAALQRGNADTELSALSVLLVAKGEALLAEKKYSAAADRFETALAVDPRNVKAYLGLAAVARAEGLPGKAARFYREALSVDPSSVAALEGQGLAFIERGARARAEANLERLRQICQAPCPAADRLQAALAAPPPRAEAVVEARAEPTPRKP